MASCYGIPKNHCDRKYTKKVQLGEVVLIASKTKINVFFKKIILIEVTRIKENLSKKH